MCSSQNPLLDLTNGTTALPSVNDNGSGFLGKSIALQHVFYLAVALNRLTLKRAKYPKAIEQMRDINNTK